MASLGLLSHSPGRLETDRVGWHLFTTAHRMTGTWYPRANLPAEPEAYQPSAGTGGHLLQHPRINELPERYRHPRHFWVFDLPEQETQNWLGRFRLDQRMWERRQLHGPVISKQP